MVHVRLGAGWVCVARMFSGVDGALLALSQGCVLCVYSGDEYDRGFIVTDTNNWQRVAPNSLDSLLWHRWVRQIGALDTPTRLYILSERGQAEAAKRQHDN